MGRPTVLTIDTLPNAIFSSLEFMDREAIGDVRGWPIGLRWYSQHERKRFPARIKRRDDIEDSWTRRLAELFQENYSVRVGQFNRYPLGGGIGDLTISLASGERVWIEIKGAWSYNNHTAAKRGFYKDLYKKYLFDRPKKCIESDIGKLATLRPPHATHIAALLIGFDMKSPATYSFSESHFNELRKRCGLAAPTWAEFTAEWLEPHPAEHPRQGDGFRCRCWLWLRECENTSANAE